MASTSSASSPSNLELKPEWPLLSSDHTSLSMYEGITRFTAPDASKIVEPTYSPADVELLNQLRNDTRAHLQQHGFTAPEHYPLKQLHWRDIYNTSRHITRVVATPDPRLATNYTPPPPHADWPNHHLHQFLVARKHNVQKAVRMLLDYEYWWHTFGMDDLCAQPVCPFGPEAAEWYPERMHGVDSHGRPFVFGYAGHIDLAGYTASAIPVEVSYLLQAYKRELIRKCCEAASARAGRRITNVSVVTSLAGFSMAHRIGFPWVRAQAYIDANFYPETAAQVLVVSAPSLFAWFWTILKTFIDPNTQKKIAIVGSDYSAIVVERIGQDATPAEWGGGCTLCDGHCLPQLATSDPSVELKRQAGVVVALEGGDGVVAKEVTVAARGEAVEKLAIEQTQTHSTAAPAADDGYGSTDVRKYTVWWSIAVRAKDIDYSVQFAPHKGEPYTVKATERIAAGSGDSTNDGRVRGCAAVHVGSEEGGGGVVTLTFSNSYSRFSSKTLDYKVGIKPENATH